MDRFTRAWTPALGHHGIDRLFPTITIGLMFPSAPLSQKAPRRAEATAACHQSPVPGGPRRLRRAAVFTSLSHSGGTPYPSSSSSDRSAKIGLVASAKIGLVAVGSFCGAVVSVCRGGGFGLHVHRDHNLLYRLGVSRPTVQWAGPRKIR